MDSFTKKIVEKFVSDISREIPVEKAVLFGSRAKGEALKHSDFDLIIVSQAFEGKRFPSRAADLLKHWNQPQDLEALCYTPKEFNKYKKELNFIKKAIKEGILIKTA